MLPLTAKAGDFNATFTELVESHQLMVYRYARFLVRDAEAADEITQEVFVTAYTKLREQQVEGEAGPWLRGVTRNLALRQRAKRKARVLFCDDETLLMAESAFVQSQAPLVSEEVKGNEKIEALRKCVQELNESEANLLKLRFEERRSREQIAETLMLSAEGVKTRLRRLRMKLFECAQRRMEGVKGTL